MPDNEYVSYIGTSVTKTYEKLKDAMAVVHKVPIGSMVTMDIRADRIRIWYDPKTSLVTSVRVG